MSDNSIARRRERLEEPLAAGYILFGIALVALATIFQSSGGNMEPDTIAPLVYLLMLVIAIGLGLWWLDWQDRRSGRQKSRKKTD